MENENVEKILEPLEFDKKTPITAAQKKAYAELQQSADDIRSQLNQLHLRLSHAVNTRDYHSLPLEDARKELAELARRMAAVSNNHNQNREVSP